MGSSSGLVLAKLLRVEDHSDGRTTQDEKSDHIARRFGGSHDHQATNTHPELIALPPENLARSLVTAYLSHEYLSYPSLLPRSLTEALDAIYNDENFYKRNPIAAFTFDMVLAISTAQVSKFSWQVLPDAETHHDRATSSFPVVLGKGGIVALQGILLICTYKMLSASYDATTSLWHLVGMAARVCLELGLHRESTYNSATAMSSAIEDNTYEDIELQRRCFWCVVAMDRVVSSTLGRPLAINLDDVDTELPNADTTTTLETESPLDPGLSFDSSGSQIRTTIFIAIIQYRIICGKILTRLHNTTRLKSQPHDETIAARQSLAHELEGWRASVDKLPLVNMSLPSSQDRSSFRSREWYDLLYHNGILMLFRPSSVSQDAPYDSKALQLIYEASQQSISIYSSLHISRRLNYSWITLHAVFIAGLSYVYAIRSHFQARRVQLRTPSHEIRTSSASCLSADPSISQIVRDTRSCSTVLVAVSERWSSAWNRHQVFGKLSDAVLADAVEFFTRPEHTDPRPRVDINAMSSQTNFGSTSNNEVLQQITPFEASIDVTNNYQDCFNDLQNFYDDNFNSLATMEVSQEWLFEIQALGEI